MTARHRFKVLSRYFIVLVLAGISFWYLYTIVIENAGETFGEKFSAAFLPNSKEVRKQYPAYQDAKGYGVSVYDLSKNAINMHEIPRIEVKTNRKVLDHFRWLVEKNESGDKEFYFRNNTWKKAEVIFQGKTYKAKIKLHGSAAFIHRDGDYRSLNIKLSGGHNILGEKRFHLIVFRRINRHFSGKSTGLLTKHLNVLDQHVRLMRVKLNYLPEALFYFESRMDKRYVEALGNPTFIHLGSSVDKSSLLSMASISQTGRDRQSVEIKHNIERLLNDARINLQKYNLPDKFNAQILKRYLRLNTALADMDIDAAEEFFDINYIARFEAIRMILGLTGHGFVDVNQLVFYDISSGKFYPSFHRDCYSGLLSDRQQLDGSVYKKGYWYPLLWLFARSDNIRHKRDRIVYNLIQQGEMEKAIRKEMAFLSQRSSEWLKKSEYGGKGEDVLLSPPSSLLEKSRNGVVIQNIALLKSLYLKNTYYSYDTERVGQDLLLHISTDSYIALKVAELEVSDANKAPVIMSKIKGALFSAKLDRNLKPTLHTQTYRFPGMAKLEIKSLLLAQALTNRDSIRTEYDIKEDVIVTSSHEGKRGLDLPVSAKLDSKIITFRRGKHILTQTTRLPKGYDLNIESGTELLMAPGVSLVVQGGLRISGTKDHPVVVRNQYKTKPFGSFAVSGNGESLVQIAGLQVDGGSEGYIDGAYYSGALSLYDHRSIKIVNSSVINASAEDGLNIKRSAVHIHDSSFFNNFSDQVDMENVEGIVQSSEFSMPDKSYSRSDVDGLDVSHSVVVLKDNRFLNMSDKGLSIGEKSSAVIVGNVFHENDIGIAVKDESRCYLPQSQFEHNRINIYAYKIRGIYNGSAVWLSEFALNQVEPDKLNSDEYSEFYKLDAPENISSRSAKDWILRYHQTKKVSGINTDLDVDYLTPEAYSFHELESTSIVPSVKIMSNENISN